jgi:twinkle protein
MTTGSFLDFNITTHKKTGQEKTLCPKCKDERKNHRDKSLSVNHDLGIFNCHHCGWAGTIRKKEMIETYTTPNKILTGLSENGIKFITEERKISQTTLLRYGVTGTVIGKEDYVCFPYLENEKIVNIKYRAIKEKKFHLEANAKLIYFGLDIIKDKKVAVICEGEIDALSFYEANPAIPAISVPNGASKGNQNLKYHDLCYNAFQDKDKVFLALDNDEPGLILRNELARRIGKDKCYIVTYPEGCKDANDVLVKHGKKALEDCIKKAIPYPLEGVQTVKSVNSEIDNFFNNGYPESFKTGISELDNLITWAQSQLTVVTGIPGSGKSELLNYIMMQLAIKHGWKFALFSPENGGTAIHFSKLAEQFTGKCFKINNSQWQMTQEELASAKEFINNHFYWIEVNYNDLTAEGLMSKFKEMITRYGVNGVCIDPWNYIEHKIPKGQTETQYISDVLSKFKRFSDLHNIHTFLVCHPVKIEREKDSGKYKVPTLYNISGSANFFNKTDNGLTVYRDFENNDVTVFVQKIRFKWCGRIGGTKLIYNPYNGTYKAK